MQSGHNHQEGTADLTCEWGLISVGGTGCGQLCVDKLLGCGAAASINTDQVHCKLTGGQLAKLANQCQLSVKNGTSGRSF